MLDINSKFQVRLEWIYGFIGGFLPFIGFGEYGYETDKVEYRTGCLLTFNNIGVKYWLYMIFITLVWFVRPMYTILSSYKRISEAQKSTCWLKYAIPLQMLISFTPYTVFAYATIAYNVSVLPGFYVAINNIFAKIMIASNPFIYIMSDSELYKACSRFLCGHQEARKITQEKQD